MRERQRQTERDIERDRERHRERQRLEREKTQVIKVSTTFRKMFKINKSKKC